MAISSVEVLAVAQAIKDGIILVQDLQELAEMDELTEVDADAIIDRTIQAVLERRDND